jgi:hypothetical protein
MNPRAMPDRSTISGFLIVHLFESTSPATTAPSIRSRPAPGASAVRWKLPNPLVIGDSGKLKTSALVALLIPADPANVFATR